MPSNCPSCMWYIDINTILRSLFPPDALYECHERAPVLAAFVCSVSQRPSRCSTPCQRCTARVHSSSTSDTLSLRFAAKLCIRDQQSVPDEWMKGEVSLTRSLLPLMARMGIHESPVVPQEETSEISACVSQRRPARSRDMDLW